MYWSPRSPSCTWRGSSRPSARTVTVPVPFWIPVTAEDGTPIPLPPAFCGGRVTFAIHATSFTGAEGDGLYEVNCQIHNPGGQAPPGTSEGVKANARGVNFNKHVTGDNLLVMLP